MLALLLGVSLNSLHQILGRTTTAGQVHGKSEVRYKTMRVHKSVEGMSNDVILMQRLYSGEYRHD